LASAYFNPFQLRYEIKSTEDVLNELLPHLVTLDTLQFFEAKLNFLAKDYAESAHAGLMEEFIAYLIRPRLILPLIPKITSLAFRRWRERVCSTTQQT
jgi:hypothetical protein